jgi:hypothetical protein
VHAGPISGSGGNVIGKINGHPGRVMRSMPLGIDTTATLSAGVVAINAEKQPAQKSRGLQSSGAQPLCARRLFPLVNRCH